MRRLQLWCRWTCTRVLADIVRKRLRTISVRMSNICDGTAMRLGRTIFYERRRKALHIRIGNRRRYSASSLNPPFFNFHHADSYTCTNVQGIRLSIHQIIFSIRIIFFRLSTQFFLTCNLPVCEGRSLTIRRRLAVHTSVPYEEYKRNVQEAL